MAGLIITSEIQFSMLRYSSIDPIFLTQKILLFSTFSSLKYCRTAFFNLHTFLSGWRRERNFAFRMWVILRAVRSDFANFDFMETLFEFCCQLGLQSL